MVTHVFQIFLKLNWLSEPVENYRNKDCGFIKKFDIRGVISTHTPATCYFDRFFMDDHMGHFLDVRMKVMLAVAKT